MEKEKKILYLDMDNVIVDFESGINKLSTKELIDYADELDNAPHIFSKMEPLPGAIQSINILNEHFNIYLLSTAPWNNPTAWSDKVKWVQNYLPKIGYKKLILTHNKHLNIGDFLVDDRLKNGADKFTGKLIQFNTKINSEIEWSKIVHFLINF